MRLWNSHSHVSSLNADNGYSKSLQFTTRQVFNVAALDTMQIWHMSIYSISITLVTHSRLSYNKGYIYYIWGTANQLSTQFYTHCTGHDKYCCKMSGNTVNHCISSEITEHHPQLFKQSRTARLDSKVSSSYGIVSCLWEMTNKLTNKTNKRSKKAASSCWIHRPGMPCMPAPKIAPSPGGIQTPI